MKSNKLVTFPPFSQRAAAAAADADICCFSSGGGHIYISSSEGHRTRKEWVFSSWPMANFVV